MSEEQSIEYCEGSRRLWIALQFLLIEEGILRGARVNDLMDLSCKLRPTDGVFYLRKTTDSLGRLREDGKLRCLFRIFFHIPVKLNKSQRVFLFSFFDQVRNYDVFT
jgi:hypothetical protein